MLKTNHNRIAYVYLSPWIVGILCFQIYPIFLSLFMSFSNYTMFNTAKYIGLENFRTMLQDPLFKQSVIVTFKYVFISVPAKLIFALIIALVLNLNLKGINLYRTIYYLPTIFGSSIAVAFLWKSFFLKEGTINTILNRIGITGPAWLGNPRWALFTIALLSIWQFGSSMVIFLAGLKQIPQSLLESASVDGAGRIQKFIHITMPGIAPMISYNLLMQTIQAFQVFAAPYAIFDGKGGPMNSVLVFGIHLYRHAFKYFKIGYSSALAWSLLLMITVTALILKIILNKISPTDE